MRMAVLLFFLVCLLQSLTAHAELETLVPPPVAGEGADQYFMPEPVLLDEGWPATAAGNTCDHSNYYYNNSCEGMGTGEDVFYNFYSPLGRGYALATTVGTGGYQPMVFAFYDDLPYNLCPCPTPYGLNGYQVIFDVRDGGQSHVIGVDGAYEADPSCGEYFLTIHYYPEQIGNDGHRGVGGQGGLGGPGGDGGVACSQQVGGAGYPGVPGSTGGMGGDGGNVTLTLVHNGGLTNRSHIYLGGANSLGGDQGADGSDGGTGGAGGGVFGNGGVGGEPVPDDEGSITNGGTGGTCPGGAGGAGTGGGGGGGGGGSAPFIGGGDGGAGGRGRQGTTGDGGDGDDGEDIAQSINSHHFIINDPFVVGGDGGRGGDGGQGGHGGGGGGGAGECWGNGAGAGGPGGAGAPGGGGGAGGYGGAGTLLIDYGGDFINEGFLQIGRGSVGGAGTVSILQGGHLSNAAGDTIVIATNGQLLMEADVYQVRNDGVIINAVPIVNLTRWIGHGSVEGTLDNNGRVQPDQPDCPTAIADYQENGRLEIQLSGTSPLASTSLRCETVNLGLDSELQILFGDGVEESDLEYGDRCPIITYSDTPGALQGTYSSVISSPVLSQGVWRLDYDDPQGAGRLAVTLVYDQDQSPVEESDLPRTFALTGVSPNPFNPQTVIHFELPREADVKFEVFDVRGRRLWLRQDAYSAGRHTLTFRGVDSRDHPLPSGTYVLRMVADEFWANRRVTLVR